MSVPVLVRAEGVRERKRGPPLKEERPGKGRLWGVLWGSGFLLVSLLFALFIWEKGIRFCGGVLVTLLMCFGHKATLN